MQGFDIQALLLLPKIDIYEKKNVNYKYKFKQSVEILIQYIKSQEMQVIGMYTDDLMRELHPPDVRLISTLSFADSYFAATKCDGMKDAMTIEKWSNQAVIDKANQDAVNAQDLNDVERFELLLKHDKKVSSAFISSYNVVFIYNYPSHTNFKATSKPNDNKIRCYVDANTFTVSTFISGAEVNACDLLNLNTGSLPITEWNING